MAVEEFKSLMLWLYSELVAFVYSVGNVLASIPQYLGFKTKNNDDREKDENVNEVEYMDDGDNWPLKKGMSAARRRFPKRPRKFKQVNNDSLQENVRNVNGNPVSVKDSEDFYTLKNPYCVVIVNVNFQGIFPPRNGGEADVKNIEHLLTKKARFKAVHVYKDCRRREMLDIIDKVAVSDEMKHHDGFICFISSHGTRKGIRAVDKNGVTVDELTSRLNGQQCPALRGKPKLFFISACRGSKSDRGVPAGGIVPDADDDEMPIPKLPTAADFLVAYSTTKEHISHRRYTISISAEDPGSWFIYALRNVCDEYMDKEDLMQIMARVNNVVAMMATGGDDHVDGLKQMPVEMFMLRKRVLLGNDWSTLL